MPVMVVESEGECETCDAEPPPPAEGVVDVANSTSMPRYERAVTRAGSFEREPPTRPPSCCSTGRESGAAAAAAAAAALVVDIRADTDLLLAELLRQLWALPATLPLLMATVS